METGEEGDGLNSIDEIGVQQERRHEVWANRCLKTVNCKSITLIRCYYSTLYLHHKSDKSVQVLIMH